ncbi:unnamed protein product [Brassica rapa subsp. trilocularis]|nr:unnamed protein product [Brassica napus]
MTYTKTKQQPNIKLDKTKTKKSTTRTKLNPIKTHHKKEIRPKENHKTRLSYIYISVEDSREFPSRVDEITQSNLRQTSGFMVFYGEIEYEEEEGSRD